MSYSTLEGGLEDGRVRPRGGETLPVKAQALLTILEPRAGKTVGLPPFEAGLRRFLSGPDFALTPEQFRASMEADFWEQ